MWFPYWYPPFGGVGVQPLLSDDCYTVEQQIMRLNYLVKKLQEEGGGGDYTELANRVSALETQYNTLITTVNNIEGEIADLDFSDEIASIETNITGIEEELSGIQSKIQSLDRKPIFTLAAEGQDDFTFTSADDLQVKFKTVHITGLRPSTGYVFLCDVSSQVSSSTNPDFVMVMNPIIYKLSGANGEVDVTLNLLGKKGTLPQGTTLSYYYTIDQLTNYRIWA